MSEVQNIIELVTELKEKAARYENQAERAEDFAKRLNEALEIISGVIRDLAPYAQITTRKGKQNSYKEALKEIWEKMQHGTQITSDLLMNSYGLNQAGANYIITKLKTYKGVLIRREGRKITLYIQKEV